MACVRGSTASKRAAHRLYITDLADKSEKAVLVYHAATGDMLIELWIGGVAGAQTVFPGSTHESGEAVTWEENGPPAKIDGAELRQRVSALAAYALIARHWPNEGGRHQAALALGGLLARAGLPAPALKIIAEAVARAANDPEWRDRRDAALNHERGNPTHGLRQLAKLIGEEPAKRAANWLGYKGDPDPSEKTEQPIGITLDDFVAYMPGHSYVFTLTRETWPAASVNAQIPPVLLVDKDNKALLDDDGDPQYLASNAWLDRNRAVEQMTWAPGEPMLIEGRLVANGGWIGRQGVTCFNLYRPPITLPGKPSKAARWVRHVRKIYGKDAAQHIIRYFAFKV
jgi:hypothetical protein